MAAASISWSLARALRRESPGEIMATMSLPSGARRTPSTRRDSSLPASSGLSSEAPCARPAAENGPPGAEAPSALVHASPHRPFRPFALSYQGWLDALVGGDDEGFAFVGIFSAAAEELDADGAIHFAIGQQPGRHHHVG